MSNEYKVGEVVRISAPSNREVDGKVCTVVDIKNKEIIVVQSESGSIIPIHVSRVERASIEVGLFDNIEPGNIIKCGDTVYPVVGIAESLVKIEGFIEQGKSYPIVGLTSDMYLLINENLEIACVNKHHAPISRTATNIKEIQVDRNLIKL